MSLTATIEQGVMAAFIAIGDVARKLTYVAVNGQPVIDFETGVAVPNITEYTVPMAAFVRMKQDELGNDIAAQNDQKVIFPSRYLPKGFEPTEADYIRDRAGRHWEIKRRMPDPAGVVFIGQVRD